MAFGGAGHQQRRRVIWARQGNVHWEGWWLREHGPSRDHIPGFDEHIGFANFDLERNGFGLIERGPRDELTVVVRPASASAIRQILQDHGFELEGDVV